MAHRPATPSTPSRHPQPGARRTGRARKASNSVRSARSCLALLAVMGIAAATPTHGADRTVTTTLDVIDAGDGVLSLREAVLAANAGNGAQNILLPAGTFTLTLTGEGENAALTGDLDPSGRINIECAGDGATIIDGNLSDRVFDVLSGARVTLSGLTIQGGRCETGGGGVSVSDARLDVLACSITGNAGQNSGGGLLIIDSVVNLESTTIAGNSLFGNSVRKGAGIYCGGSDLTVTACTISGNDTFLNSFDFDRGGGIGSQSSVVTIHDSTLSANRAVHGAALWSDGGDVLIQNTTIADNRSLGSAGGVLSTFDVSLTLRNCLVSGNTAVNSFGGGLVVSEDSFSPNCTLEVTNSTFRGNVATNFSAGGLLVNVQNATIRNCTITENAAAVQGGGIFNGGHLTIRDSIVVDNTAPVGGDLFLGSSGTVDLINSTVGDIAP